MVFDEPTAALPPALVSDSYARIADLARDRMAVLLIEQRARQAMAISGRGIILDGGQVALSGAAADLLADERAVALHRGSV